jgi:hypothetical protein
MLTLLGIIVLPADAVVLLYVQIVAARTSSSSERIPPRSRWLTVALPVALFAANAVLLGVAYQTKPFGTTETLLGIMALMGMGIACLCRLVLTRRSRRRNP